MSLYASLTVIDGRSRLAVADCGSASTAAGAQPDKRNDSVGRPLNGWRDQPEALPRTVGEPDAFIATYGIRRDSAARARSALADFAARQGVVADTVDAVKLAVSEAVTNHRARLRRRSERRSARRSGCARRTHLDLRRRRRLRTRHTIDAARSRLRAARHSAGRPAREHHGTPRRRNNSPDGVPPRPEPRERPTAASTVRVTTAWDHPAASNVAA